MILRQHEQTLDWLVGLDFVDPERIGFYGLSYGGKPLYGHPPTGSVRSLNQLGRFQRMDRQERHLSLRLQLLFTGEYEMPEFNLGNTFNYATMVLSLLTSGHTNTPSFDILTLV